MTIDDLVRFVRERDRSRFGLFAQQGSEPSPDDVTALEARVGFALPDDVREFLCHPLGGLVVEAAEDLWPRPRPLDVGPAWTFRYGVQAFSLSPAAPDFLDLWAAHDALAAAGAPDLVPLLQVVGDGDRWCMDAAGQMVAWRHDDPEARETVEDGFFTVLLHEIDELDRRIDRLATERA